MPDIEDLVAAHAGAEVLVKADGVRASFVLDSTFDPSEGSIDLSDMLPVLVRSGLEHPYSEAEGSVPFGHVEVDGEVEVVSGGVRLSKEEVARALGAGFLHAVKLALDIEHARVFPAGRSDAPEQAFPGRAEEGEDGS